MSNYTVQELVKAGGREWNKSEQLHRVYFEITPEMVGMTVEYYNTGNIASATKDGEKISNGTARQYLNDMTHQLWYDVPTGQFFSKGFENSWIPKRAQNAIVNRIGA